MKTTLQIQNLKCGGCAHTVTTKLTQLDNIKNILVDVDNDAVTFEFVEESDLEQARKKLLSLGYPVVGESNSVTSKAKSFVSCAVGRMVK